MHTALLSALQNITVSFSYRSIVCFFCCSRFVTYLFAWLIYCPFIVVFFPRCVRCCWCCQPLLVDNKFVDLLRLPFYQESFNPTNGRDSSENSEVGICSMPASWMLKECAHPVHLPSSSSSPSSPLSWLLHSASLNRNQYQHFHLLHNKYQAFSVSSKSL